MRKTEIDPCRSLQGDELVELILILMELWLGELLDLVREIYLICTQLDIYIEMTGHSVQSYICHGNLAFRLSLKFLNFYNKQESPPA